MTGAGDGTRGAARARLRVAPTTRSTPWMRPRARAVRASTAASGTSAERRAGRRRRRRRLARRRSCARRTCATRSSRMGVLSRDVRDRDHLGALPGVPRAVLRRGARGASASRRPRHLPLHARLSRRPGAVLHGARPGAARRGGRAVGAGQGRRVATRSSPRAARSPTTTRSAATTAPGTTASAPTPSPRRCAPRRPRSIPPGSSTRAC